MMIKTIITSKMTILAVLFLLILSGCASTPSGSNLKKASSYNVKLGTAYLRSGSLNLSNEKLLKALKQDPDSSEAHHIYALLQQRLGKNDEAKKHFRKALNLDNPTSELHNNYGSFLCKQKDFENADKQFKKALKNPLYRTPEYALTNAGICANDAGNTEEAEKYLQQALDKNPHFSSALYEMAKVSYNRHDFSRAQAFLFRYNEVAGNTPKSLSLCRSISLKLGESTKAEQCTTKLLSLFPKSKEATKLN
jgi:type IV pilus assembly protein PilF